MLGDPRMSDAEPGTPLVTLTISPDTGLGFVLSRVEAVEELGRPFLITLDVSAKTPKGDLHTILGNSATVTLSYPRKPVRRFNGIIARLHYLGLTGGAYRYRIELRPWIWLLSHEQDCRIFSGKSAWTIMTGLFRDAGFTDFSDKRQNAAGDLVLEHCVQYRESTFAFVTRLMEQFGLYYFVTHADGVHTLNFADDPASHSALPNPIPYRLRQAEWHSGDDQIWDWAAEAQIQPGAYTLRDYNFTTPKADLTAKSLLAGGHAHGTSEVYDYPGQYDVADHGQKAAQVRMQDFAARRQVSGGTSNSRLLGCGSRFTLSEFTDSTANQEYLVVESTCLVQESETQGYKTDDDDDLLDTFVCTMRAVPSSHPFRLPNVTSRPLISGPQTARVAGERGQELTTDQYGRIKVKFPWDRRETEDENSSCWIRVSQSWAGQGWGAMFIPRIGQEVIVEFLDGNPDRPIVTGQVYNADMTVPYGLPDNKTRSTIKSNSSQGGGGFNELRFEDKKDAEEVFFQAQKDFNEVILNSHTSKITQDTTTTIDKGKRDVTLNTGDDTLTISKGNRSATVAKGDDSLNVTAGSSTITAGKQITLKVGGNTIDMTTSSIKLTVGSNSIELGPSGITISGSTVSVSGSASLSLDGGPSATLKAILVEIN